MLPKYDLNTITDGDFFAQSVVRRQLKNSLDICYP